MGPIDKKKLLDHVGSILDKNGYCVVCVAEGVGQENRVAGVDKQGYAMLKVRHDQLLLAHQLVKRPQTRFDPWPDWLLICRDARIEQALTMHSRFHSAA